MRLMKFREVHVTLGFWEDVAGFNLTDDVITSMLAEKFLGAHVSAVTDHLTAWEVPDGQ